MSRTPCPVETCDRPMPGSRVICGACEADIARALASVPGVCADLDVTLARQTSRTTAGRSAVVPLPYDPRASEAAYVLRSTLAGWVRALRDQNPDGDDDPPDDTPPAMAAWLSQRLQRLVRHPAAPEAHGEIVSAVAAAQRVVDRRPGYLYAGPCDGCGHALYAKPGAEWIRCPTPGCESAAVRLSERREWMLEQCKDLIGSSSFVAMVCTGLGYPVSDSTVREWVRRKHLSPHSYQDPRGDDATKEGRRRPVYRVEDVIQVWTGEVRRYTAS